MVLCWLRLLKINKKGGYVLKTFKPRRILKSKAISLNPVLSDGEMVVEVPDTGVGTGACRTKMGDGKTAYVDLPYMDNEVSNSTINFVESSTSDNTLLLSEIVTGKSVSSLFGGIKKLLTNMINTRSHVGMIVMSTSLDTQAKVIAAYGGTTWTKIEGKFLIGADSTYKVGSTGGSTTHKITESELPSHNHSIPKLSGSAASAGKHQHNLSSNWPLVWNTPSSSVYGPWASPFGASNTYVQSGTCYTTQEGAHTHNVTTNASTTGSKGSGSSMSILNPYKAVYIWEKIA